jgi:hypothetical protein
MARKQTIVLLLVLVVLAGLAGYQYYSKALERRAQEAALAVAKKAAAKKASGPYPDTAMSYGGLPKAYPRPTSIWRSNEKAFYSEMLSKGRFEWLVVPIQVQFSAVDRATRSLMTAQLAMAIGASGNLSVPDPYLVSRALGDGERRLDLREVYALANQLGVKRIVWGYVGHRGNKAMRLTMQYQDRGQGGDLSPETPMVSRHFDQAAFSDEIAPIEVFQTVVPEVLKWTGLDPAKLSMPQAMTSPNLSVFPASPLSIMEAAPDPALDALLYQLLAVLAPRYGDRTGERLFEKSLLAVYRLSPESPGYRVLKARTFMHLGLRPAALKALGTPETPEEQHLLAMLNGNLPEAQRQAEKIADGPMRLIASAEVNAMAVAYGVRDQKASIEAAGSVQVPGDVWRYLVVRAFVDWDDWSQFENAVLKALLDREFPLPDYSLESMLQGIASLGDMAKMQDVANLSVLNHIRRLLDSDAKKWCCMALAARPSALDYLDLIESLATDNLMRRAKFFATTQGSSESALEFLSRIESVYKEHPQHALARAAAEFGMAKRVEGPAREGRMRSAYLNALNAYYWEQGQTPTAADAFNLSAELGRNDYGRVDNPYAKDYPFRSYFPMWASGGNMEVSLALARAALAGSTNQFAPVEQLSHLLGNNLKQWDKVDELIKSIEGRFAGHPRRAVLLAKNSLRIGDVQGAQGHYRASIEAQPGYWDSYLDLGILLLEDGNVAEAGRLFTGYPGFKKGSTEHPVGLSNHAYNAGSIFYWTGHFDYATPLYRIAAELRTGSDASLSSEIRLRLMRRDLGGAAAISLDRARRYNSSYAYRDYLGLLHSMGQSKLAWDAFNVLVPQMDEPQVWETALVGHRLEGLTEAQLGAWAGEERWRRSGRSIGHAAMYLLRAGVTDRMPSGKFAAALEKVDRPVWQLASGANQVVRPAREGNIHIVLGPVTSPGAMLPLGVFENSQKTRVKSDLAYFAEAYRAIRSNDFMAARLMLQEAATLYDLSVERVGYLLPYYAYASARSGQTEPVRQLLERIPRERQRFDYQLARAVLEGIAGDAEASVKSLMYARYRRSFTESRPFYAEYQYAELCEWLYEATRNAKYREIALDWARTNQTFQPWFAWAYAIEAKLSTDAQARGRAIAMTYYLDKNSERLSAIPRKEVEAAVRKFGSANPFLRPVASESRSAT